ncbi:hypothetical protein HDV00_002809 [Rhizophlyctis rosea]|nr:hypothetical protein HDV00_002809 [Rhizophlyctis rosea]
MALVPVTKVRSRASWMIQGFGMGLMTQGLSRWGLASPFDTALQNSFGNPTGTPRPDFSFNTTLIRQNATITWTFPGLNITYPPTASSSSTPDISDLGYDAFSLVANDVEIYRGVDPWFQFNFLRNGPGNGTVKANAEVGGSPPVGAGKVPWYLRIALVSGGASLDYSDPVVVFGNGTVVFGNGTVLE